MKVFEFQYGCGSIPLRLDAPFAATAAAVIFIFQIRNTQQQKKKKKKKKRNNYEA